MAWVEQEAGECTTGWGHGLTGVGVDLAGLRVQAMGIGEVGQRGGGVT